MKNNVFLFTWEDRFSALNEIKRWKTSFISKYWAENVFEFKTDNFDGWDILNSIFSWWLFVNKKLVIIYWFPKDTSWDLKLTESKTKLFEEKITESFDTIPDDCIVVFVSFSPDKRTKFFKFLSTNANIKNFEKLNKPWLVAFVKDNLMIDVDKSAIDYFIDVVWTDMFSLFNESIKLRTYAKHHKTNISQNMIDNVVFSQTSINAFDILDSIFVDKSKAFKLIAKLKQKWYDEFSFLWMLQWWTKALINIMDSVNNWLEDSKIISSKLWLHPFVVAKNLSSAKRLMPKYWIITNFFKQLVEIEYSIKTWKLPIEIFWLEINKSIIWL